MLGKAVVAVGLRNGLFGETMDTVENVLWLWLRCCTTLCLF